MRAWLPALVLTSLIVPPATPVAADPITYGPPSTSSFGWADGEARAFSLVRGDTGYTFSVNDVGTSVYPTLTSCCTDVFDRVRQLNPGSSLLFSNLALNTLPINTTFVDNLNFDWLKRAGLDNVGTLTGLVTLQLAPDQRRSRAMRFTIDSPMESDGPLVMSSLSTRGATPVPEPATVVLMGIGLVGLARVLRKRP